MKRLLFLIFIIVFGWQLDVQSSTSSLVPIYESGMSVDSPSTSQAIPVNDDCSGALTINESTDDGCTNAVSGTTIDATHSSDYTCGPSSHNEVWFSFTPTSSIDYLFTRDITGGSGDARINVWTGTCGSLVRFPSTGCNNTSLQLTLTANTTYYISIASSYDDANFDLCIYPAPPAPSNDDCGNATIIIESTDLNCNNEISGTTLSATNSSDYSCSSTYIEVWYEFTPATTGIYVFERSITSGVTNVFLNLWSGSCGALSQVNMDCFSSSLQESLTQGMTYYVSVANFNTGSAEFDLCIYPAATAPSNNDCSNATSIQESYNDGSCNNAMSGTTLSATNSADYSICSSTYNDVWYTFSASTNGTYFFERNITNGSNSTYINLWTGSCGSLTKVNSNCYEAALQEILISGTTYYVSVATDNIGNADFDLCIYPAPPPPSNDDCGNAISLTVNTDLNCGSISTGDLTSATASGESEPTCSGDENDDVWYVFTALNTEHQITISNVTDGGTTDMFHSVWEGSCGVLTNLSCSNMDISTVSGLTIGSQYFVRVNSYGSGTYTSTFDICIGTPAPENDDCSGAIMIGTPGGPGGTIDDQSFVGSTDSENGTQFCGVTGGTDMWYMVSTDVNGGSLEVEVDPGTSSDVILLLYKNSCGSLLELYCADVNGNNGVEQFTYIDPSNIDGHITSESRASTDYMIRVIEKVPSGSTFSITVSGDALPVTFASIEATINGSFNTINWSTIAELNNEYMILERSVDGSSNWSEVDRVQGHSFSTELRSYEILDKNPTKHAYYRINALDRDGQSAYSDKVYVDRTSQDSERGLLKVYPIPTTDNVVFSFSSLEKEDAILRITDISGNQVIRLNETIEAGISDVNVDITSLPAGVYFVSVVSNTTIETVRIVKQ